VCVCVCVCVVYKTIPGDVDGDELDSVIRQSTVTGAWWCEWRERGRGSGVCVCEREREREKREKRRREERK